VFVCLVAPRLRGVRRPRRVPVAAWMRRPCTYWPAQAYIL